MEWIRRPLLMLEVQGSSPGHSISKNTSSLPRSPRGSLRSRAHPWISELSVRGQGQTKKERKRRQVAHFDNIIIFLHWFLGTLPSYGSPESFSPSSPEGKSCVQEKKGWSKIEELDDDFLIETFHKLGKGSEHQLSSSEKQWASDGCGNPSGMQNLQPTAPVETPHSQLIGKGSELQTDRQLLQPSSENQWGVDGCGNPSRMQNLQPTAPVVTPHSQLIGMGSELQTYKRPLQQSSDNQWGSGGEYYQFGMQNLLPTVPFVTSNSQQMVSSTKW